MSVIASISTPRTRIELRPVSAAGGITITVTGAVTEPDASELGRHLHAALEAGPAAVVVNLGGVPRCGPVGVQVLTEAHDRARTVGVALHLLRLGAPDTRAWLAAGGLNSARPSLAGSRQAA